MALIHGPGEAGHRAAWWPGSRVDQKALDAQSLLAQLSSTDATRPRAAFRLQLTSAFDALVRAAPRRCAAPRDPERDADLLVRHEHERGLGQFVAGIPASVLDAQLCRQLEESNGYQRLARRAGCKARCLAGEDRIPAVHALHGLEILQLEEWYFGTRLGVWIPDDVQAHSDEMGFRSLSDFYRALIAEYLYCGHEQRADAV